MKRSANGSGTLARTIAAAVFFVVLLSASACGGQYLGSLVFAKLEKLPTTVVGLTTLYNYWIAYGDIGLVKRALIASSFLAGVVTLTPIGIVIFVVLSGFRRSLHGDARFATLREIRESGLVGNDQ